MKQNITNIRKAVATMANQLKKLGYSLSNAFKKAWQRIKESMTCKVSGTSYGNRQELLKYIASQNKDNLTVHLKRDRANEYDRHAVAVVIEIKNVGYAHIGYLPKGLTMSFSEVIEKGIPLKADLQIIGGYEYKTFYGALIKITL